MKSPLADLESLLRGWSGGLADWSLKTLLDIMRLAFDWSEEYRRNIEGFEATYVFESNDGQVNVSAVFRDGRMEVLTHALDSWDLNVSFKNTEAFWKMLLAGGDDVLQAVLDNEVEVYGNLNYLYKFGYMVMELIKRLDFLRTRAA